MENKPHALAAGIFVLVLSSLLVSLLIWLTRDTRSLRTYELSGHVNVTGLQVQATVRWRGVPVGQVTAIRLDPQARGQVLVHIAVDDQAPITATTYATLGFQGVTGLAFIQLDDTNASAPVLDPSAAQRIPLRPGLMSKLTDQGEHLLSQLEQASQRFNQLLSDNNQQVLISTVAHLGQAAADLQQLSAQTRQLLPALVDTTRDSFATMRATSVKVGESAQATQMSARAFQRVSERMNGSGGTLDRLGQSADILIATGQTLQTDTLPHIHRATVDAARAVQHAEEIAQTWADTPQALIFGRQAASPGPGEPGFVAPVSSPVQ